MWGGSSWTAGNDVNTARRQLGAAGEYTSGLIFAGRAPPPFVAVTEDYNGVSFSEVADLSTARSGVGNNNGTLTAALAIGGDTPGVTAATEEWSSTSNTIKTISTD